MAMKSVAAASRKREWNQETKSLSVGNKLQTSGRPTANAGSADTLPARKSRKGIQTETKLGYMLIDKSENEKDTGDEEGKAVEEIIIEGLHQPNNVPKHIQFHGYTDGMELNVESEGSDGESSDEEVTNEGELPHEQEDQIDRNTVSVKKTGETCNVENTASNKNLCKSYNLCIYCKNSIPSRCGKHMRNRHSKLLKWQKGKLFYKCQFCSHYSKRMTLCLQHMKEEHCKEYNKIEAPTVPCPEQGCQALLATPNDLELHKKRQEHIYPLQQKGGRETMFSNITSKFHKATKVSECHHSCQTRHEGKQPFLCGICHKVFPYHSAMVMHECECNKDTVKGLGRDQAVDSGGSMTTTSFQCAHCDESFKNYHTLSKHVKTTHDMSEEGGTCHPGGYLCKVCHEGFSSFHYMRKHLVSMHPDDVENGESVCDICGKTFLYTKLLMAHIWAEHERIRRFKCKICNKDYLRNSSLRNHMISIHAESCEAAVYRGVINKLNRGCELCKKKFRSEFGYTQHMRKHKGLQAQLKCDSCGKTFTTGAHLKTHARIHSKEKIFQCPICKQRYTNEGTVYNHLYRYKIHGPLQKRYTKMDLRVDPEEITGCETSSAKDHQAKGKASARKLEKTNIEIYQGTMDDTKNKNLMRTLKKKSVAIRKSEVIRTGPVVWKITADTVQLPWTSEKTAPKFHTKLKPAVMKAFSEEELLSVKELAGEAKTIQGESQAWEERAIQTEYQAGEERAIQGESQVQEEILIHEESLGQEELHYQGASTTQEEIHIQGESQVQEKIDIQGEFLQHDESQTQGELHIQGESQVQEEILKHGEFLAQEEIHIQGESQVQEGMLIHEEFQTQEELHIQGELCIQEELLIHGQSQTQEEMHVQGESQVQKEILIHRESQAPNIMPQKVFVDKKAKTGKFCYIQVGDNIVAVPVSLLTNPSEQTIVIQIPKN